MTTYQSIEANIKQILEESKNLYMMNREQIFIFITKILSISDTIANYVHDIDLEMLETEKKVATSPENLGISDSALTKKVKKENATLIANKDWAKSQLSLLSGLRIAALSAQRSAE